MSSLSLSRLVSALDTLTLDDMSVGSRVYNSG